MAASELADKFRQPFETADRRVTAIAALLVGFLVLAPFISTEYVTGIVFLAITLLTLAMSWNLLAGYAGQISLGHAGFFGMGAFISAWLTTPASANLPAWLAIPALPAIVFGGVGAALIALVTGPALFRLHGHYFAIGTLAFAEILKVVMVNVRRLSGGSAGYYIDGSGALLRYYYGLGFLLLTVATTYYLLTSRTGLGIRAIKRDEGAADSLGVNPLRYKMIAFVISSFFAGIAGGAYAQYSLYINPTSTLSIIWMIDIIVIVILGGMGTMIGPILGTVLFMFLDTVLAEVIGELATTIEGIILIAFVIFLPTGFYGYLAKHGYVGDRSEEHSPAGG